jgi:hypothetical protein
VVDGPEKFGVFGRLPVNGGAIGSDARAVRMAATGAGRPIPRSTAIGHR